LWVAATLAGLVVLLALVLCVPLNVTLRLDMYGKPKFRLRLAWLFGLVAKEVRKGREKPKEKRKVVKGKPETAEKRRRAGVILDILRTKGLLRQVKNLLRDLFSCLRIRDFGASLRVGLDNPADTGLLFAVIGPVVPWLSSTCPTRLRVQPSFADEAVFEGYLYGAVRLRPIQLVIPFLGFVLSLPTLRVIKTLVRSKWKRKKK